MADFIDPEALKESKPNLQGSSLSLVDQVDPNDDEVSKQLSALNNIFQTYQTNDHSINGIQTDVLYPMINELGLNLTREKYDELIEKYLSDEKDMVRFEKFASFLIDNFFIIEDSQAEIVNAFKIFDEQETGFIKSDELRQIMQRLGDVLSEEEVNLFITKSDIDRDGMVNYEEFVKVMFKGMKVEDAS